MVWVFLLFATGDFVLCPPCNGDKIHFTSINIMKWNKLCALCCLVLKKNKHLFDTEKDKTTFFYNYKWLYFVRMLQAT